MDSTIIKQLVDLQRGQFETWVLACAAKNLAFYRQFSGLICVAHEGAKLAVYDFESPIDNVVYSAIRQTRELMASTEADVLPMGLLLASIQQLYANPVAPDPRKGTALPVLQHEFPQVIARAVQILGIPDVDKLTGTIGHGMAHWVSKSRIQKLSLTSTSARFDPQLHAELVSSIQRHALAGTEKQHCYEAGFSLNQKKPIVERISSGLGKLDNALGGGFGRKEATLFVAPQGSGKTVMAVQLAGTFASQRRTGLLITTEQHPEELEYRLYSNFGNVPFAMIKDGIDESRLPPDIVRRIHSVSKKIGPYLHYAHWSTDRGQSVATSLDAEIATFVRKYGKIDWLVFDWLGGALGVLSNKDLQVLRLIYKAAADHLCVMAEKYNMPTIGFAQANIAQARNKPCVDASMITENKQLGEKFTNGFGISALTENYDPNNPGAPVFLERQNLYPWKARKSEGKIIKVKRDFGYQRFSEK